jgi:hypothetical protein
MMRFLLAVLMLLFAAPAAAQTDQAARGLALQASAKITNLNTVNVVDYRRFFDSDWTPAFTRALATGKNVIMPELVGGYTITDKITIVGAGQRIIGAGPYKSYFHVTTAFNMSATSVVSINTARDSAAGLENVGIAFDQPVFTARSNAIQYPWAIAFTGQSRVYFGGIVRITGAWNGINAAGDSGGISADELQIGALNTGMAIDGAADFITIRHLGCWPYGFSDGNRLQAWGDGSTTCFTGGRIDGLSIHSLTTFQGRVAFAAGTDSNVTFGSIDSLSLDGNWARLDASAGYVAIGTWYKSSSAAGDYAMNLTGGQWRLGQYRAFYGTAQTQPGVLVAGAAVTIASGFTDSGSTSAPAFRITSGNLTLDQPVFNYGTNTARTAPFVDVAGGTITLLNPRFQAMGSGSGNGIVVAANNVNSITANQMNGWGVALPTAISNGSYAFDTVFTATPSVSFSTPGDSAFTYTTALTQYRIQGKLIFFRTALAFNTNAFTTAATGSFQISTGIPFAPTFPAAPTLPDISNITFSGYLAPYLPTSNLAVIRNTASGAAEGNLGTANIKASSTGVVTNLNGTYAF